MKKLTVLGIVGAAIWLMMEYNSITAFTQFDCKNNPKKSRLLSSVIKDSKNTRLVWGAVYPDSAI